MRIGFDAKRLFNNQTGLGNYSRTLLQNLSEFYPSHSYHLYTPTVNPALRPATLMDQSNVHLHVSQALLKPYWRSYSMIHELMADKIEVYHGLSHELPFPIHKVPTGKIVTIHDLIFKKYPRNYPLLDRKGYDLKCQHAVRQADRVIAISAQTKRDLEAYYSVDSAKIEVIYQSCDPLFYQIPASETTQRILHAYALPSEYLLAVGSITPRKNLGLIVEAYAQLPIKDRVPLMVVGKGKRYRQAIAADIRAKGLDKWVRWISDLEDLKHLQAIYQGARALIYPSLYEGFGLPIVEALLSKTPVITASTSALPEAGGPDSLYIDPQRPDSLAEAIQKLLGDSALRNAMQEKGYAYAHQQFDRKILTTRMMQVYQAAQIEKPN